MYSISFGTLGRDHQPGIEHALVGRAHVLHGTQRRLHDFGHDARAHRGVDNWRRRIGAHAAGIRPLVAIECALVVLRRSKRQRRFAVAQGEERCFFAVEKFLDDEFGASRAKLAAKNHLDGGFRLGDAFRYHHALAGGEPVGLDDDRRAAGARIGLGFVGVAKALVGGGRYAGGAAQILGEALGTLKLRRGAARPESLDACGLQVVHNAGAKRGFRPNDNEIDAVRPTKRDDRGVIGQVERDAFRFLRDAGIAGGAEQTIRQRTGRHLPGERVLASTGAEKQNIHLVSIGLPPPL